MKTKLILVGGFLGAGKTAMLWEAADRLMKEGKKVALITNDQASQLVDSELLMQSGLKVAEVSGSCFCCNFGGFADAIKNLREEAAPDVIIAEPVGSCADLSATILQPLKKYHSAEVEVAPFTVLTDPARISSILDGGLGGLHEDAAYILRKQLEEADIILLTKADAYPAEMLAPVIGKMEKAFPGSDIKPVSALSGQGVDEWLDKVQKGKVSGTKLLEIDYDTYAHGEAVLGWLNGTVIASGKDVDWDAYASALIGELDSLFKGENLPVGHVKIIVENGKGYTVGNIAGDGKVALRHSAGKGDNAKVIVNARVETTPEHLDELVKKALVSVNEGLETEAVAWKYLQPGRPDPTYRFDAVVDPE
ncbi:MAG: cobalamin synthesis protein P47K [Bacteroidales bacterium]|nr:cobalamin synthesis protein P47K [Bacteroidales bacterium]MBQ9711437.1 cobalamin synthesis protein P47K [Bacteroidales bacterium]